MLASMSVRSSTLKQQGVFYNKSRTSINTLEGSHTLLKVLNSTKSQTREGKKRDTLVALFQTLDLILYLNDHSGFQIDPDLGSCLCGLSYVLFFVPVGFLLVLWFPSSSEVTRLRCTLVWRCDGVFTPVIEEINSVHYNGISECECTRIPLSWLYTTSSSLSSLCRMDCRSVSVTLPCRVRARASADRPSCTSSSDRSWIRQYTENNTMPTNTRMFTVSKVLIFRAAAI